jgi:hypothetical protein
MFPLLLLFGGTLLLSFWASWRVKSVYKRFAEVPTRGGLSGAETARRVMAAEGVEGIEIVAQEGMLGDHYDPIHRRLVLSQENYHGSSVSAIAVAAHEAGHAIQHARAYGPLEWRMLAVGATTYASQIVMWLPLIGLFTGLMSGSLMLAILSLGWGVIMLFNLVTLPVEFDASRRARVALANSGIITEEREADGVNRVLNAAAFTYVAAFITSLGYLIWHLIPLLTGRSQE